MDNEDNGEFGVEVDVDVDGLEIGVIVLLWDCIESFDVSLIGDEIKSNEELDVLILQLIELELELLSLVLIEK
jgi:hypothetical protein